MSKERRRACLQGALKAVNEDRNDRYGEPEQNFENIASLWTAYLQARGSLYAGHELTGIDVALLMDLMKTARLIASPDHADSWKDKAGYSACGYDLAILEDEENENLKAPARRYSTSVPCFCGTCNGEESE